MVEWPLASGDWRLATPMTDRGRAEEKTGGLEAGGLEAEQWRELEKRERWATT
ncbi:hypothetical protein HAX54_011172, partial [Datura stramonium]|nr:hypothetical protein [Datura stramonium]